MNAITPRLADRLGSLAESQLQIQMSRSAALDAGALGVMGVDVAVAAIVLAVGSADYLWVAALLLPCVSLGVAIRVLRLAGAEQTGPLITPGLMSGPVLPMWVRRLFKRATAAN
jgi:hypothetical protein